MVRLEEPSLASQEESPGTGFDVDHQSQDLAQLNVDRLVAIHLRQGPSVLPLHQDEHPCGQEQAQERERHHDQPLAPERQVGPSEATAEPGGDFGHRSRLLGRAGRCHRVLDELGVTVQDCCFDRAVPFRGLSHVWASRHWATKGFLDMAVRSFTSIQTGRTGSSGRVPHGPISAPTSTDARCVKYTPARLSP